jgi:sigma-B regulation protein RsbU (phosphoserine phosphatase)
VAGDYYDFVTGPRGQIGLVVGDVSDKGMHAALFMAVTRSIIRASVSHATTPAEGIAHANRLIQADASPGMFVTLFYGLLDPDTHAITYVNAGHNPPLVCARDDHGQQRRLLELRPTGMALGVDSSFPYEQRTIHFEPDDLMVLYTDGVPDVTRTGEERFGMDRMRRVLLDHHHSGATGVVAALEEATDRFRGPAARFDDMAILAIKRVV